MKNIKLLLIFNTILFLPLFLIDSVRATAWDKAQTSKSGIVDMLEVLPEYLQVNSTAENRDFHIKRNERSLGTGTQYYFYMEGGTLTVSMTTNGILRIGSSTIGISGNNTGIGTTTPSTALEVIGTVTATGFSGNGAGLTNMRLNVGTSTYGNPRYIIDIDGVAKSTSGTTSTVLLYTAPVIAGGTLGVDGVLAITSKWSLAGTTTSYIYIPQFKINNTSIWYRNVSPGDTPPEYSDCYYTLINRGSTTSQIGNSDKALPFAQSVYAFQTFAFNTSQDMTLTVLASGNAAQTITLESIIIEVLNP